MYNWNTFSCDANQPILLHFHFMPNTMLSIGKTTSSSLPRDSVSDVSRSMASKFWLIIRIFRVSSVQTRRFISLSTSKWSSSLNFKIHFYLPRGFKSRAVSNICLKNERPSQRQVLSSLLFSEPKYSIFCRSLHHFKASLGLTISVES